MRKIISVLALVAVLIVAGGCGPEDGGSQPPPPRPGGNGGQPPAAGAPSGEFVVLLAATDHLDKERGRTVVCAVTGLNAEGNVVEITDVATGLKTPYVLNDVRGRTPFRVRLKNYGGVHVIKIVCELQGQPGDTIFLEALTGDERRTAPLIDSREIASTGRGRRAQVSATIAASA